MDEAQESVEQPLSAEDKIANMLFPDDPVEESDGQLDADEDSDDEIDAADESEEVEAKDDEGDEPEYIEMEIDGNLYEVPANLKDHIMRQQDYTQKTQEISSKRKEVEARIAQVETQQKQYEFLATVQDEVSQIQQLDATIPQYRQYIRDNIDTLSATDIEKVRFQIEEMEGQRNTIAQAIQTKTKSFQQAQEQSVKELLDKSTEALRSKIPDWQKVEPQVTDFVLGLGFTEQQLQIARLDPTQMQLAHDAWKYRQLKDGSTAAVAKLKTAPQIKAKPRNPMPKEVKEKLNLRKQIKSGNLSSDKKADLIGQSIANKFF